MLLILGTKQTVTCVRPVGLVAWFSLRVREVPGSTPGQALLKFYFVSKRKSAYFNCWIRKKTNKTQTTRPFWFRSALFPPSCQRCYASPAGLLSILTLPFHYAQKHACRKSENKPIPARPVGLVAWFSLWVREAPGSTPGQSRILVSF